jgi:hypothetical protein
MGGLLHLRGGLAKPLLKLEINVSPMIAGDAIGYGT